MTNVNSTSQNKPQKITNGKTKIFQTNGIAGTLPKHIAQNMTGATQQKFRLLKDMRAHLQGR